MTTTGVIDLNNQWKCKTLTFTLRFYARGDPGLSWILMHPISDDTMIRKQRYWLKFIKSYWLNYRTFYAHISEIRVNEIVICHLSVIII